jgi:hypothetical protein
VLTDNVPAVADYAARGGGATIPGVSCDATCADSWAEEHRPIANQPASAELHRELRNFRTRLGLLPRATIVVARVNAAVAGVVGVYVVGTLANKKLLRVGFPSHVPAGGLDQVTWVARQPGAQLAASKTAGVAPAYATEPLFELEYSTTNYNGVVYGWNRWEPSSSCQPLDDVLSYGKSLDLGIPSLRCFEHYEGPYGIYTYPDGRFTQIVRADDLTAPGPIEDYTGQTYDKSIQTWPDKPTTREELESRTRDALQSDDYNMFEAWELHQLDPENYPDPTTTEKEDHRCDLTNPLYKNPQDDDAFTPAHAPKAGPFDTPSRPPGAIGKPDPLLRYGTTSWAGADLDSWDGWGWRHIRAKHGWSSLDAVETQQTLEAPGVTFQQSDTSMKYVRPVARPGARWFVRGSSSLSTRTTHTARPTHRRGSSPHMPKSDDAHRDWSSPETQRTYERDCLREVADQLGRVADSSSRQVLGVHLEGAYPNTQIVIRLWERVRQLEVTRAYDIWKHPILGEPGGRRLNPPQAATLMVTWALGG